MLLNTIDIKKCECWENLAWDECWSETLPTLLRNPQQPTQFSKKTVLIYLFTWLHFWLTILCCTTELQSVCKVRQILKSTPLFIFMLIFSTINCTELRILAEWITDFLGLYCISSSDDSKMRQKFKLILYFHWRHKRRRLHAPKVEAFFLCCCCVWSPSCVSQHC